MAKTNELDGRRHENQNGCGGDNHITYYPDRDLVHFALNALPGLAVSPISGAADQYFSQLQRTGYPDVDFLAVPDDHPVCPHRRAAD